MRVGSEPCSGCDAVFINYAQRSVVMVLIRSSRESVERFEPAMVGMASFFASFLGMDFKELMLSVKVDRFLEIPARRESLGHESWV